MRLAGPEDARGIAALHAASWAQTYGEVLSADYLRHRAPAERQALWQQRLCSPADNQRVVVAHDGPVLAGFACVFVGDHGTRGAYLDNLHVAATHRSQGVGATLVAEVAAQCERRCPGQGLYLYVNQANTRAQAFYAAQGASRVEDGVWHAPDGSQVPTFVFAWPSVRRLARRGEAS